jgi:hypothetical protein
LRTPLPAPASRFRETLFWDGLFYGQLAFDWEFNKTRQNSKVTFDPFDPDTKEEIEIDENLFKPLDPDIHDILGRPLIASSKRRSSSRT